MPLTNARDERLALQRQGMVGYALYDPAARSQHGSIFHRLTRAEKAAGRQPGAQVVLVRDSGQLYHQSNGRSIGPVLGADGQGIAFKRVRPLRPSGSAATPRAAGTQAFTRQRAARGIPNYER